MRVKIMEIGIFSTAEKLFVWRLRPRAQKAVIPLLTPGGPSVKSVTHYKYLGIVLDTELSDDKVIQRQLPYQYCAANKLRASFSRCSNAVQNVLLRSFCMSTYASQLWSNFRISCMQTLRVPYNFGCMPLNNPPWRVSVVIRFNANSYFWGFIAKKCVPLSWTMQKL